MSLHFISISAFQYCLAQYVICFISCDAYLFNLLLVFFSTSCFDMLYLHVLSYFLLAFSSVPLCISIISHNFMQCRSIGIILFVVLSFIFHIIWTTCPRFYLVVLSFTQHGLCQFSVCLFFEIHLLHALYYLLHLMYILENRCVFFKLEYMVIFFFFSILCSFEFPCAFVCHLYFFYVFRTLDLT